MLNLGRWGLLAIVAGAPVDPNPPDIRWVYCWNNDNPEIVAPYINPQGSTGTTMAPAYIKEVRTAEGRYEVTWPNTPGVCQIDYMQAGEYCFVRIRDALYRDGVTPCYREPAVTNAPRGDNDAENNSNSANISGGDDAILLPLLIVIFVLLICGCYCYRKSRSTANGKGKRDLRSQFTRAWTRKMGSMSRSVTGWRKGSNSWSQTLKFGTVFKAQKDKVAPEQHKPRQPQQPEVEDHHTKHRYLGHNEQEDLYHWKAHDHAEQGRANGGAKASAKAAPRPGQPQFKAPQGAHAHAHVGAHAGAGGHAPVSPGRPQKQAPHASLRNKIAT